MVRSSLGKYQLLASLGQGGMAKVYLAVVSGPVGVNKLMVVKVINNDVVEGLEGGVELFWDEARLAARLLHPNIVHTYEVGEIAGNYFLAMEYLDGQVYRMLQARTARERLPLEDELRILCEVARGLHYAHELTDYEGKPLGVVHRDISPQNVFITYEGQVKLIDFGIAKTRDAGHETRVGLIKGKLNYIAPEQLRGEALDRRADVFALGVMLWEAITGRRFAGGANVTEVSKVHTRLKGEEPKLRTVKPDVAEPLAQIVDTAIALEQDKRFPDAASFADAIEAYMEQAGMRPSARALATRMQAIFAQERTSMQKQIDTRLQAMLNGEPGTSLQELPVLGANDDLNTGSGTLAGGPVNLNARLRDTTSHNYAQPASAKSNRRTWAALAVAAATAAAVAVYMRSDSRDTMKPIAGVAPTALPGSVETPTAPLAPPVAAALAGTPTPVDPASAYVALTVSVVPPEAVITIDGAAISVPFSGAFPKDGLAHRIEARAPGYRPWVRLLPIRDALTLDIV
ncbi:MAG TPA: serine/threonine-protein kinase, partial [Polyangiales bacterium]